MVEVTHFIVGAHKCLINESPNTLANTFERFLRWQRINAPKLVARDEDLHEAIEKMEMHDIKKVAEEATHRHEHAPKLLRK